MFTKLTQWKLSKNNPAVILVYFSNIWSILISNFNIDYFQRISTRELTATWKLGRTQNLESIKRAEKYF